MATTSTDNSSNDTVWTPQSKKDMALGLIVIIASIGSEPILGSWSREAMFVSLLFIVVGVCISLMGYFSLK